jgi:hypothetical protein
MKLLETIAEGLSNRFVWSAPITLEMQTCGEANARFEFRTKKVIVCYELADEFSDLYGKYGRAMSLSLDPKVSAATPANIAPSASGPSAGVKTRGRKAFRSGRPVR